MRYFLGHFDIISGMKGLFYTRKVWSKFDAILLLLALFLSGIIALFVGFSVNVYASETEQINAGFVSGIWYSKSPFFVDENVRVYVAFQNSSESEIIGEIEFYDNGKRFATKDFSALSGRLVESWADFATDKGDHVVHVKLVNVKRYEDSGWSENIEIESNIIEAEEIFVDYDTDGDGIGNEEDKDDDGDGFSDREEDLADTDPLDKNDYPEEEDGGGGSSKNKTKAEVLGMQFVNSVTDTAGDTITGINSGADSLNEKIQNKIDSLEKELEELKNKNNGIKQTILEGRAEINAPAESKKLSRTIALKTGELYLFKTLWGILEYKILLYLLLALVTWFTLRGIWKFARRNKIE